MTAQTETFVAGASLTGRFAALRAQIVEAAAKRKTYRVTLNELSNLTDHELDTTVIPPAQSQPTEVIYLDGINKSDPIFP